MKIALALLVALLAVGCVTGTLAQQSQYFGVNAFYNLRKCVEHKNISCVSAQLAPSCVGQLSYAGSGYLNKEAILEYFGSYMASTLVNFVQVGGIVEQDQATAMIFTNLFNIVNSTKANQYFWQEGNIPSSFYVKIDPTTGLIVFLGQYMASNPFVFQNYTEITGTFNQAMRSYETGNFKLYSDLFATGSTGTVNNVGSKTYTVNRTQMMTDAQKNFAASKFTKIYVENVYMSGTNWACGRITIMGVNKDGSSFIVPQYVKLTLDSSMKVTDLWMLTYTLSNKGQ